MAAAVEIGQVRKFCEAKGLKVLGYKGSGSYGKVFHVESKVTHLRYVAKVCTMKEDFTPDNFRREASLQERLSSKYIVRLYEYSFVIDKFYIYYFVIIIIILE